MNSTDWNEFQAAARAQVIERHGPQALDRTGEQKFLIACSLRFAELRREQKATKEGKRRKKKTKFSMRQPAVNFADAIASVDLDSTIEESPGSQSSQPTRTDEDNEVEKESDNEKEKEKELDDVSSDNEVERDPSLDIGGQSSLQHMINFGEAIDVALLELLAKRNK